MKSSWIEKWLKFLAPGFALIILGCAAINPATAPAPLAEIPSAVSFPGDLEVDVSEVGAGAPVSGMIFTAQMVEHTKGVVMPIGGEFFDGIVFGFTVNQLINAAVEGVLAELTVLEIPTNPITTTFEASSIFSGTDLKIDFSDFDYDGTGSTKGCTGCTCPTGCGAPCPTQANFEDLRPVCYRIWNDPAGDGNFVPLMAGFFDQLPIKDNPATPEDEENPGVGSFRVTLGNQSPTPPDVVVSFGADYDHRNPVRPLDLSSTYYLSSDSKVSTEVDATVSHVRVQQVALGDPTDESRLLKTIQQSVNQPIPDEPDANSTFQYQARYRTDFDFWSGTFLNFLRFPSFAFAAPPPIENFTDACAQLTTAVGVDPGVCQDLGIDVSTLPFLELLLPTDPRVNLPADFPPTPPF